MNKDAPDVRTRNCIFTQGSVAINSMFQAKDGNWWSLESMQWWVLSFGKSTRDSNVQKLGGEHHTPGAVVTEGLAYGKSGISFGCWNNE